MTFCRKLRVMFQASGMRCDSQKETQNSVFSERISPAVKELLSLMRGFYKVQQFYIKHWVTPDESPSKHNFQFFQHEEVSSTHKRRCILEDLHSYSLHTVLKLCWSCTDAEMLSLITSLQPHPGNLGKFSKTRAETASQKTLWQKEHHICWEYSVVTGTQPTHKPVETVNGNNKNEIKLTIPIIASISTLHGSTTAF